MSERLLTRFRIEHRKEKGIQSLLLFTVMIISSYYCIVWKCKKKICEKNINRKQQLLSIEEQ